MSVTERFFIGIERHRKAILMLGAGCFFLFLPCQLIAQVFPYWSGSRLYGMLTWFKGVSPYSTATEGLITSWIYGPTSIFFFSPALLARTPTGAILIANHLSAFFFFFPFFLLFWLYAREGKAALNTLLFPCAAFILFFLVHPGMRGVATLVLADSLGLFFASLAALGIGTGIFKASRSGASALFLSLALWTKQQFLPLLILLPLAAYLHGLRSGLRFTACFLGVFTIVSGLFIFLFGWEPLWLNLFVIPSKHPWYTSALDNHSLCAVKAYSCYLGSLGAAFLEFLYYCTIPLVCLAGLWFTQKDLGKGFLNPRLFWVLLVVAVALIPTSVLGRVKSGGSQQNYALGIYFFSLAAALVSFEVLRAAPRPWLSRVILLAIVMFSTCLLRTVPYASWAIRNLHKNEHMMTYEYIQRTGGDVYLPQFPLSTLMALGVPAHFHLGLAERELAGISPPASQVRAYSTAASKIAVNNMGNDCSRLDFWPEHRVKVAAVLLPENWVLCAKQ